jgi:hypothetical protein
MIYKDFRHLEIFFGSDSVGEGRGYKPMVLLVQEIQHISARNTLTI